MSRGSLERQRRAPTSSTIPSRAPVVGRAAQQRAGRTEAPGRMPPVVRETLRAPGEALDLGTRTAMERRFGHDFSQVRIHTDARAAESAESIHAAAYTLGQDVVFGAGRYSPATGEGQRLLAHELAHTVQQRAIPVSSHPGGVSQPPDAEEREAETAAESVTHGGQPVLRTTASPVVRRQALPGHADLGEVSFDLAESASPHLASAIGSVGIDGFEVDSDVLSDANKKKLQDTARNIPTLLRTYPLSTMRVIGYADAPGKESRNQELGQKRAEAVRQALVTMGVPDALIVTESKGENELLVKTNNYEPKNRRVEVLFEPRKSNIKFPTLQPPALGGGAAREGRGGNPPFDPRIPLKPPAEPPSGLPPDFWKPLPPPIKGTQKSVADVLNDVADKVTKPIIDALPERMRGDARDLVHKLVEKGEESLVDSAVDAASGLDDQTKAALKATIKAVIKQKPGQ